jgi:NADH-quinone oxidoreductase B subunit
MGKLEGSVPGAFRTALDKAALWSRINSPWLVHFNSGSCNGCDIEILATLAPRYDLERFGVKLQGSPRHADVLICTGPVTRQARERLLRTYEQMPSPKFVIAVGSCSISGGAFHGCYNIVGDVGDVIPVDVYIPGCPPRPEAIIDGVVQLLQKLKPPKAVPAKSAEDRGAAKSAEDRGAAKSAEDRGAASRNTGGTL